MNTTTYQFLEKMRQTTSTNEKVEIIRFASSEVRKTLYYTYNTFMNYGVTEKQLEKRKDLCNASTNFNSQEDLFTLLDSLNCKILTGHNAIKEVNGFLHHNPQLKEILYLILGRNLKIRVSVKLINKACPNLIPTFNVALANKYDDKTKKKVDFKKDVWYVSRKLDGVRCIIMVDEKGNARSYSRAGKQFYTLSLVEKEIESLGVKNVVYDGEMCIVNKEGDEDFQSIMKEINRKDHTITNGLFQIFDFIPTSIFYKGYSDSGLLSQRTIALKSLFKTSNSKYLKVLSQTPITSFEELDKLTVKASEKGWEGLMLRKNDFYKGKRSNDILKVKTFHDDEYIVKDLSFGPFRYIKEGKEVEEDMLTAVSIMHRGNTVSVGSGFTIDQRKIFYKKPDDIIGKTITVQYFEESQNQDGDYSLRFPVIKAIHGEKRQV